MRVCFSAVESKLTTLAAPCLFIGTFDQASSIGKVLFVVDVFGSILACCTSLLAVFHVVNYGYIS